MHPAEIYDGKRFFFMLFVLSPCVKMSYDIESISIDRFVYPPTAISRYRFLRVGRFTSLLSCEKDIEQRTEQIARQIFKHFAFIDHPFNAITLGIYCHIFLMRRMESTGMRPLVVPRQLRKHKAGVWGSESVSGTRSHCNNTFSFRQSFFLCLSVSVS